MDSVVLAAVDLAQSSFGGRVLKTAKAMADLKGLQLAVVTVLPDYGNSFVGSFFADTQSHEMVERTQKALHEFVRMTIGDDSSVQHVILMGSAYQEVLKTADKLNASLIVIGANKPDVTDFLIGPNAARIARHAVCSVYICR